MAVLPSRSIAWCLLGCVVLATPIPAAAEDDSSADAAVSVGPDTEKRFPPLIVPEGFRATLFACDPLVEYPSVIALGPRAGTLFVAHDYVTGLGIEIVRRDEVRLISDSDADGYADRSTVFAGGFNSIQGLAYYGGTVFVMHAPLLTSLRDTNSDGVADERRDLIKGLGLPPEENSNRLHCANGVTSGHDGWLYLSLGDRGCDVQRPEGDRLLFQQGGILRCRFDGSGLHVFSRGLRNIYDVALDDELNVFVRDNENDGGDYMIRVCHCFFGSDHGYPYHYYERPDELMPPLADLGRGSSAGGTSYLETAFPKAVRESLFFCEWGRAVVRYPKARRLSSFETMIEADFAAGAPDDPYGFKPTDLVVDRDGSLLISDWCDGQRPKRGRGRIYRITYSASSAAAGGRGSRRAAPGEGSSVSETQPIDGQSINELIEQLDSASYHKRVAAQLGLQLGGNAARAAIGKLIQTDSLGVHARMHSVWIIALTDGAAALDQLFAIAESDSDPRVRVQAVRALGDLTDPVLTTGRVDSGPGDPKIAERIARLANNADPRVVLAALTVMCRLNWSGAPAWISENLSADDPALNHAATQTLRNARDWNGVIQCLNGSPRVRRLALHSLAEQREPELADALIERLAEDTGAEHRQEYADALSRIVRKREPWTYWGFRPEPRPAATVDWEKTDAIVAALNRTLADPDRDIRSFALQRMLRENVRPDFVRVADWLGEETSEPRTAGILTALRTLDAELVRPLLIRTVSRADVPRPNRLTALDDLITRLPDDKAAQLVDLTAKIEDGPVMAALLAHFGGQSDADVDTLLLTRLDSSSADVRAAAMRSLGQRRSADAAGRVTKMLQDPSPNVRLAAAEAAGLLAAADAADVLVNLSGGENPALVAASLTALTSLEDGRASESAVTALKHRESQIAALRYLGDFRGMAPVESVLQAAANNQSADLQQAAARTLAVWLQQRPAAAESLWNGLATLQGRSGQPLVWTVAGPLTDAQATKLLPQLSAAGTFEPGREDDATAPLRVFADATNAELRLTRRSKSDQGNVWLAWTPVRAAETDVEVLSSATGQFTVHLGDRQVYERATPGSLRPDSDRFSTRLSGGTEWLIVRVRSDDQQPRLQLRFRRRSSKAEHERLIAYALASRGNAGRGRDTFLDKEKSSCIRCHRLGEQGGRIGPDLTGIGRRFSRIHLIESILEPSRTVAPSYATITVVLNNGQTLSGIRVSRTDQTLVLGDNQAKLHEIAVSDIDAITTQKPSTMPEGLEKKLTDREFLDLLAFLESQK